MNEVIKMSKSKEEIEYIYNQMNESEKFGVSFGMFPQHIVDYYKLNHDDIIALMNVGE